MFTRVMLGRGGLFIAAPGERFISAFFLRFRGFSRRVLSFCERIVGAEKRYFYGYFFNFLINSSVYIELPWITFGL